MRSNLTLSACFLGVFLGAAGCRKSQSEAGTASTGSSLHLDGATGYMKAPFAEPDPFTSEATLSASVYFDELPSKASRIFSIVGKSGVGRDLDLQAEPDDRFHFYVGVGAPNVAVSTTKIQTGVWYHVDATYRANGSVDIYVDGAPAGSTALRVKREPNNGAIVAGANLVFPNRWFRGRIDDVALYERALSPGEIAAKSRTLKGNEPGLVAAYRFEEDTRDLKQKHDGQLVGGAQVGPPGSPVK